MCRRKGVQLHRGNLPFWRLLRALTAPFARVLPVPIVGASVRALCSLLVGVRRSVGSCFRRLAVLRLAALVFREELSGLGVAWLTLGATARGFAVAVLAAAGVAVVGAHG